MECVTSVWKFSGESTGYPTLFWVHWTACGESGPRPQVVLFDRSVWSDRNLLFHVKKFSFPFLLCQAVIKLSVKTEWIPSNCLVTLGALHSTKKSGLHFWQRMAQHFPKFLKRGHLASYNQIFGNFFREVFFPFNFDLRISRIFGRMVHISKIQQFVEFLDTFLRNFCTTCLCLQIFKSFSWMESALCFNQCCSVNSF